MSFIKDNMILIFVLGFMLLALIIIITVITLRFTTYNDNKTIESWAKKNNLVVVEIEKGSYSESPFKLSSFDSDQMVYKIKVKESNGNIKSGWLKVHGLEKGVLMERVEARWDTSE